MSKFKVQVPTEIVRSKEYTDKEFVLLAKLIHIYYMIPEEQKSLTFGIKHKDVMFYTGIKDNDTFKKSLKGLYEKNAIKNEIISLPRKGGIEISLNEEVIPEMNQNGYFTQLQSEVLSKNAIDVVGHNGVRLLYYYQSYINTNDPKKTFCFVAEVTTAEDLGITEKTVIKYNKLLEKNKFIKIERHKVEQNYYTTKKGNESYLFTKYNNHYYIKYKNISSFCEKTSGLLA